MSEKSRLTYKRRTNKDDIARYAKAITIPFGIFLLAIFIINNFSGFGRNIIAPLTSVMWGTGAICAKCLPSLRTSIINETHATIGGYLLTLIGLKTLIGLVSGVSAEMMMATYNQALPATSGSSIAGLLQTMMWISSVIVPLGYVGMEVKKIYSFRKKKSKAETLMGIRNIRDTNAKHME